MNNQNPYDTFGGVFVPHFLLSSRKLSPAAKLLYALLASRADIRGEALLNPALLAIEMGTSETTIHGLADELGNAQVIKIRQDAAGTEFLRCYFPMEAWSQRPLSDDRDGGSEDSWQENEPVKNEFGKSDGRGKKEPASRFSKQVCTEYAKARQRERGNIDNPFALGTAMWKSGEYDEEITLWLQTKEADESAA